MKIQIYNWKKGTGYNKFCGVCGKQAYRSIYNDKSVGNSVPAWYACYRKKCYTYIAFQVLYNKGTTTWEHWNKLGKPK